MLGRVCNRTLLGIARAYGSYSTRHGRLRPPWSRMLT